MESLLASRKYSYDLLAIGRSVMDIYASSELAFAKINSFSAFVGGTPANISLCASRLGLRTALLTAMGNDFPGKFIAKILHKEQVKALIELKEGYTPLLLMGLESSGHLHLVSYCKNCADLQLSIDDVLAAPICNSRMTIVSGTGFLKEPVRSSSMAAIELAKECKAKVFLDLEFRAHLWADARSYGAIIRSVLPWVDIVVGNLQEIIAAGSKSCILGVEEAVANLLRFKLEAVVVKKGKDGSAVYLPGMRMINALPFPARVCNSLGAGDAFAGGFIFGYLNSWDWKKCARMGNAVGAMVVEHRGCAEFMPHKEEALQFIDNNGGF